MRTRLAPSATSLLHQAAYTVDVVLVTALATELGVLLRRTGADARVRERWILPCAPPRGESMLVTAERVARDAAGIVPAWMEQVGAFNDGRQSPELPLSVAYVGLIPIGAPVQVGGASAWFPLGNLPPLSPRHAAVISAAAATLRSRVDHAPIAFRLLPATFSLGDLQRVYELVHGRHLHKASFRRALHAAWLVEPTDEWRSEGRGRPAQLFRFMPRKRRRAHRGVRFDFGG
jgi:8-oxo-dGTP diphosphatase